MQQSDQELTRREALHSIAGAWAVGWAIPGYEDAKVDATDQEKPRVNYRVPKRDYVVVSVGPHSVQVEKSLQVKDKALAQKAVDRLVKNIDKALDVLPKHASFGLRNVRCYLMYGPKAPGGGRDNGLEYMHPKTPADSPTLDPRWGDSIVVYCAQNYVGLSDLWAIKSVVHEFAHAYQLHNWPEEQPEIMGPYEDAMKCGLYRKVNDVDGKTLDSAYATTNQLEYFAELTCIYFGGCNYQPFNRSELKQYDPAGFAMVERFWRVGEGATQKAPPKTSRRGRR
jgi:hypothetical protein